MNDTKFIHSLPIPTCISDYDRQFVDVNQALLIQSKAGTLENMQNYSTASFIVDKCKFDDMEEMLYSGQTITNYLVMVHNVGAADNFRFFHGKLLSDVDKLFITHFISGATVDNYITMKHKELLNGLIKLKPYMNAIGRKILESMYEENRKIVDNEIINTHLAALSRDLIFKYPNLSNRELNLCAYFALGFSTKEMAAITGLSSNSLRVHVYNICQKLKLSSRDDLRMEMMRINGKTRMIL